MDISLVEKQETGRIFDTSLINASVFLTMKSFQFAVHGWSYTGEWLWRQPRDKNRSHELIYRAVTSFHTLGKKNLVRKKKRILLVLFADQH